MSVTYNTTKLDNTYAQKSIEELVQMRNHLRTYMKCLVSPNIDSYQEERVLDLLIHEKMRLERIIKQRKYEQKKN